MGLIDAGIGSFIQWCVLFMVVHQTCVMEGIQPQHCLQAWGKKKKQFPNFAPRQVE